MALSRALDDRIARRKAELAQLEERKAMRESSEYQWLKSVVRRLKNRHQAHDLAERVDALAGVVAEQERQKLLQRTGVTQHDFTADPDAGSEDAGN